MNLLKMSKLINELKNSILLKMSNIINEKKNNKNKFINKKNTTRK